MEGAEMVLLDKLFLGGTTLVAVTGVWYLGSALRERSHQHISDHYHRVSLSVLGLAATLLAVYGWGILGMMGDATSNKLVATVSSLIPFSWATGLVARFYPRFEKPFLALMILGVMLILISRFMDAPLMSRIVYPVFHSVAALVVILTPILAYRRGLRNALFIMVSLGGTLISIGGISLAFLMAGKQLMFFSQEIVLMIFAPLLFVTATLYFLGFKFGEDVGGV